MSLPPALVGRRQVSAVDVLQPGQGIDALRQGQGFWIERQRGWSPSRVTVAPVIQNTAMRAPWAVPGWPWRRGVYGQQVWWAAGELAPSSPSSAPQTLNRVTSAAAGCRRCCCTPLSDLIGVCVYRLQHALLFCRWCAPACGWRRPVADLLQRRAGKLAHGLVVRCRLPSRLPTRPAGGRNRWQTPRSPGSAAVSALAGGCGRAL